MTMNMPESNGKNLDYLPEPSEGNQIFDPLSVATLANQFYTALPVENNIAPLTPPQSAAPTHPPLPQPDSRGSDVGGVVFLGSAAPSQVLTEEALTRMAQQFVATLLPTQLETSFKQALTQPEPISPSLGSQPTALPAPDVTSEAFNPVPKEYLTEIPSLLPIAQPDPGIPTSGNPTAIAPISDLDWKQVFTEIQDNPLPAQEPSQPSFYFLSSPKVENLGLESGEPFDVQAIRKDFPILHQNVNGKPLIWMDNAATTQKPQSVIDSLSRFYQRDNSNIHRGAHTLAARATDAYESAREKVQRFLGASSASEIIFVRGTTEAINLVAQTYGRKHIGEGDEILLSTLEHHANIVPWQMLAQQTGAIIKVIPVSDRGEILLEEYAQLLSPRTRLVGITQVSNALGTVLPVREMTEVAHRHGVPVLVDGAQAVSHFPVNVQDINCDFYTLSGHKLFAPTGIGALYVKREILEDLPPWQGGGSMIRSVSFEKTVYSDPPAKFEAGTPNIADAVGLGAAIDYITRLGMHNIEQYEHKLTCYATKRLAEIPGLRQIGTSPHKVSVLSFILDDIPVEQVGQRLAQEGIAVRAGHHCAQPTMQRYGLTGTVRPSLAFYNTCAEIDTLIEVLQTLRFR
ncbi:putative cysteine desulfurase [Planktothrix tepida]|uniref:Cysteine desulfurase n=2 Tax=Planktothrix TaxID=54304 RepID=A0A1J1LU98_9CYAN|nr:MULTISPECIES: cysteine desulfurase [Planktothrix]CAD5929205.1 putative cysteine desulfurase [Planktothrix pseudagardhii]CAD5979084.1 putative cysteine desulfurase [Planktothrix tepida]CUR36165.1 putative cysteine desulfurase [Planktothrix tepida PCC 9214]